MICKKLGPWFERKRVSARARHFRYWVLNLCRGSRSLLCAAMGRLSSLASGSPAQAAHPAAPRPEVLTPRVSPF